MDRLDYTIVAVLDLGTTHSGYAFSYKSNFNMNPMNIQFNPAWIARDSRLLSLKTPTCIILDRDKELNAFGYEAESVFAELCMDQAQDEYFFFKRFYTKKNFTSETILNDETGKALPANHVFKVFIKAFVDHLMKISNTRGMHFEIGDIRWVIPVPAYLTDTGKQFLRSCAEKAGIMSDQLMFVTKVEAAFHYSHHYHQILVGDHDQKLKDGNEYMVVHIGGSIVDITVLKKDDNQLVEKYKKTDNECGGTSVNDRFSNFLVRLFGSQFMTSLQKEDPAALLDLERCFETIYRNSFQNKKIYLEVPLSSLDTLCEKYFNKNMKDVVSTSVYGNVIMLRNAKIGIDSDIIRNLFKPTIDTIINVMENVFADYTDAHKVMDIVMVGGFSRCVLVEKAVRQKFSNKNIIIPYDPEIAVMKGAVLCGHQPCQYIEISSAEMKAAQTSVTKCIFCDNPGVYHCIECKSAFCQLCRTNHDKLPAAKTHTVTDLKKIDPSAFSANAICVSHKKEFIFFCTRCNFLICSKCVTTDHKGHDITDIKTVADDYRRIAEGNISVVKEAVKKLSTVVEQMKEIEKPTIKRTSETAVSEIDEAVEKITKAVSFTKHNKLDEVQSRLDIEIEEFQYNLKNKEWLYEQQKNLYDSFERLMHVSHDITFITSYETLKRDIHDISDFVGEKGQEKVYKLDQRVFVQEVVNAIVSGFEMSLVGKEDGSVVLMHKTEIQKKENETKQK